MKAMLSRHAPLLSRVADRIEDALPFGNGKFGGVVYRPAHWEWVVGKLDVDVDVHKDYKRDKDPGEFVTAKQRVEASSSYQQYRAAVRRKDAAAIDCLVHDDSERFKSAIVYPVDYADLPRGNGINVVPAFVQFYPEGDRCESFRERLDLYCGEIVAQCRDAGKEYSMTTVCDPNQDVFAASIHGLGTRLPFSRLALSRPPHDVLKGAIPEFGRRGDCIWLDYRFANHFRYAVVIRIAGATFITKKKVGEIAVIFKTPVRDLTIFVACATCLETEYPLEQCLTWVAGADFTIMRRRNCDRWHSFWNQSSITIDDDIMENAYYFNQYAFACCNGKGAKAAYKAAGLYGLWTHRDNITWTNRVYGDINIEMAYQHVFSSNHPELIEAFIDMVWAFLPAAREQARKVHRLPGACFTLGPVSWQCIGPWYCSLLWDYYSHTGDRESLRRRIYPILKAVGDFCIGRMGKKVRGRYVWFGSAPPERKSYMDESVKDCRGFSIMYQNVSIDLAFIKALLRHLIEASRVLGVDADQVPCWRELLSHFPNYPTVKTLYGRTIVDMDEYRSPLMCQHPNTLAPIYPARELHFSQASQRTALGRATARSCQENIKYYTFNGVWLATAFARMGLGDEAEKALQRVLDYYLDPSGFLGREIRKYYTASPSAVYGPEPGNAPLLETGSGFVGAINEMLVQEQDRTLFVFPAVPKTWKQAAFNNLRIPGAFLVSAEYAGGVVRRISIKAEREGKLKVSNPWSGRRHVKVLSTMSGVKYWGASKVITLEFKAGETITLAVQMGHAVIRRLPPIHSPKVHVAQQGYHVFLGKDLQSGIIEAVEAFCFPAMMCLNGIANVFEFPIHHRYVEMMQNMYFKFDFGTNQAGSNYSCFGRATWGDKLFIPVMKDTVFSPNKRYGWVDATNVRNVKGKYKAPLVETAVESQAAGMFQMRLDPGDYQCLLLHGNGTRVRTRIEFPVANAVFLFDAPNHDIGIEGFGIRAPCDHPLVMKLSTDPGYVWRMNALLVKRVW